MSNCDNKKNNLFGMSNFKADTAGKKTLFSSEVTDTYSEVPNEMNVFQRSELDFLPEGKTLEDLTAQELIHLRRQYRFDYYKPGVYQGITWRGNLS